MTKDDYEKALDRLGELLSQDRSSNEEIETLLAEIAKYEKEHFSATVKAFLDDL